MSTKTLFDSNASAETKELIHETIDHLVTLNRDAVEGYKKSAELLNTEQFSQLCLEFAEQRERFINELVVMMNSYDGTPTDKKSLASTIHTAWMNIKDLVTDDDSAILAECDRGEEVAIETYEAALEKKLPGDVETLLGAQLVRLREVRDRIHKLTTALA